jgi:tight adherence protein B
MISGAIFTSIAIAALVMAALGALAMRFASPTGVTRDVLRRMSRPEDSVGGDIIKSARRRGPSLDILWRFYQLAVMQKFEESMWQAGMYGSVAEALLVILMLFGAGIAAAQAAGAGALVSILCAICGGSVVPIYIKIRRGRRLTAFVRQLPFALDLLRSSIEAGHSLMRGLQVVVAEFSDPLSAEFRSVIEQSRLGLPLPRALEEMLKRVPERDLRLLVVAVKVQAEVGSSLAVILGRLSEIVRTRQRIQAQIKSLTAQSRMSGMVVAFLPAFILVAFSIIQPSYTETLFHDPAGQIILKGAIFLDVLAFITIRRLLRVRF